MKLAELTCWLVWTLVHGGGTAWLWDCCMEWLWVKRTFFRVDRSVLVFLSSSWLSKASVTIMSPAALWRAVARANLRSFLFMLMLQSLGCRASACIPHEVSGGLGDCLKRAIQSGVWVWAVTWSGWPHLLAHLGAKAHTTAWEQWGDVGTTASITSTLLGVGLLATTANLAASQGAGSTLRREQHMQTR